MSVGVRDYFRVTPVGREQWQFSAKFSSARERLLNYKNFGK